MNQEEATWKKAACAVIVVAFAAIVSASAQTFFSEELGYRRSGG
jgi:hypothetical protein